MDGVNTDKLFEAMEVEFEDIMDQESSNEEVQSNNAECLMSDDNIDHKEKFVQPSEIRALNRRIKHCIISCYYIVQRMMIPSSALLAELCSACINLSLKKCISSGSTKTVLSIHIESR